MDNLSVALRVMISRRHRRQLGFLAVSPLFLGTPLAEAAPLPSDMPHFQFEQQAQQHCPADAVVWVVATRGLYNSSSERWYGRTSNGTYACLGDAEKAGYRATPTASAAQ
jgi:hypothetical protein